MAIPAGKKAAPFTKGGGRDPEHPNTSKGEPKKIGKSGRTASGPMKDIPSPQRIDPGRTNTPLRKPDNIIQNPGDPAYKNPGFDEDPKIKPSGEPPVKHQGGVRSAHAARPSPSYGTSTPGGVPTGSGDGFDDNSKTPTKKGLPATKKSTPDTGQTGRAGSR